MPRVRGRPQPFPACKAEGEGNERKTGEKKDGMRGGEMNRSEIVFMTKSL